MPFLIMEKTKFVQFGLKQSSDIGVLKNEMERWNCSRTSYSIQQVLDVCMKKIERNLQIFRMLISHRLCYHVSYILYSQQYECNTSYEKFMIYYYYFTLNFKENIQTYSIELSNADIILYSVICILNQLNQSQFFGVFIESNYFIQLP